MQDSHDISGLTYDNREEGVFRVHRKVFVDPNILELERRHIFDRSWLFAGHISEFSAPRDFVTRNVAGRPIILVHGVDGSVRAFLNSCRHRGNLVCREKKGSGDVFRCFYHGWIYGIHGELRGVPGEESYSDAFDKAAMGLEPVPRMHNHRGLIFVSFDPDIESFESFMGAALAVIDNTLDLGDMEFTEGQYQYSTRANWKLLVENSMDGYHALFTHERFFTDFMPAMGMSTITDIETAPMLRHGGGVHPLGNGHVSTGYPSPNRPVHPGITYLEQYAKGDVEAYRRILEARHGPERARMIERGSGNYLIFPNLIIIDGWRVFRTFYPTSPDYMEINGWACFPKEDTPALRKARLDWYLGFQGPGGFATPDDVEGLEGCQMGFATHRELEWSDISRGMKGNTLGGPSELQMRVFWREWNARITTGEHAPGTND